MKTKTRKLAISAAISAAILSLSATGASAHLEPRAGEEAIPRHSLHFDRHTSYVAKRAVNLYTSRKGFKTEDRLHASLGKRGDKFSTLDFVETL